MSMIHCQLWMGSLESYMTETFILKAFQKMGERAQSVKVMRNKLTGEQAGYCFVHFETDEEAIDAMHKLNGKLIPATNPPVRFRLNNASNTGRTHVDREFSVWVGDLTPDVDDYNLYRVFSSKYNTIKTAKVILDNSGFSKGYGFVRFGSDEEMRNSLTTMNGYVGLGSKPLKICNAVPKPKGVTTTPTSQTTMAAAGMQPAMAADYSQYYDPATYWQNYAQQWGQAAAAAATPQQGSYYEQQQPPQQIPPPLPQQQQAADGSGVPVEGGAAAKKDDTDLELIDHSVQLDVDKMNRERIEQDCNLWDALEASKWFPQDALEVF